MNNSGENKRLVWDSGPFPLIGEKFKTILAILFFALIFLQIPAQHQAMYSQYMFNGLVLNPAYTGSRGALSLTGLYRNQWAGFKGAPKTISLMGHSPIRNPRNNLGLTFIHDRLGVSQRTGIYGSYAYRILFPKGRLSMGIQSGLTFLQDRWSEVVTNQGNDLVFISDSPLFLVPQFGFGAYYDARRFYLGASSPTIFSFKNDVYRVYVQNSLNFSPWFFTGGTVFDLNPDLKLKPSFLVKYMKNTPVQVDLNANLIIKDAFWVGLSYRTGDALIALLEFQINPQFRIGYSYDQSLTQLRKFNNGSHELALRYEFGYNVKAMSPRYF